jgi:NitT/TauT family transport system ATP-binding protein
MGKSGSGKSTLINLLLGLVKPDEGEISISSDTRFSAVFQEDRLMEHLSAYDNLRLTTGCRRSEIFSALEALGLNPSDRSPVRTYSGGMKRRVALSRGILFRADVLLLDEPFRGLDEETREQAIAYLMRQWADRLIILVTHDEEEARRMGAAQTVFIESHE